MPGRAEGGASSDSIAFMPQCDEAEVRQRVDEVEPSKLPEPCTLARGVFGDGRLLPAIVPPKAAPR
eukprot:8811878-Alexandrium_andersonii.AAC.1